MANFQMTITDAGLALLAAGMDGEAICFTKFPFHKRHVCTIILSKATTMHMHDYFLSKQPSNLSRHSCIKKALI